MSKHRHRAPDLPDQSRREALVWGPVACALVPVVLLWSGSGWAVALGSGALVAGLGLACLLALRLTGVLRRPTDPRNDT